MTKQDDNNGDKDLFKQSMSGVKRHQHDKTPQYKKPVSRIKRNQPTPPDIEDNLSDDFIPDCAEFLEFRRAGIQKSLLKQIRTGKLGVEDRLDLHGCTRDKAGRTLLEFIHHAQLNQFKLVCVVHGKGYHSEQGRPVLKAMVNKWLQNIDSVLAFTSAHISDGGNGAVYVLLKRLRDE